MHPVAIKIGELAKQTGVSVRTLHYYDEIGLLSPSKRTDAGYRLYTKADVVQLQQIISLRQIGFSLDQIRDCLNQNQFSPQDVVQMHLSKLREQMASHQKLYARLEAISSRLQSTSPPSIQDFIQLIEETIMFEKYYTPDQLDALKEKGETLGEESIQQFETEWQLLISQAQEAMANGVNPASDSLKPLARRSQELIELFTGGDTGITRSLNQIYQQEGAEAASRGAMDSAVMDYMQQAREALKL